MEHDPEHLLPSGPLLPAPRGRRERLVSGAFQTLTRFAGLRPGLLPEHMRRQLRIFGASDEQVLRVLPNLRSLAEWPYHWEAEGDARAAEGDWYNAFTSYYIAQRLLMAQTPLKRRLYQLALDAYAKVEQPTLERFTVKNEAGDEIAGYLQIPEGVTGPVPCVVMVPGITGTKEELHPYSTPLLRRGVAIARLDNPMYGETSGILRHHSIDNPRHVVTHVAKDPRIDPTRVHLHGMSLGAHFAISAAHGSDIAGLTVLCPPYRPGNYFRDLPTLNRTALQHMTQHRTAEQLQKFTEELTLEHVAPELRMPLRIFHGGRDRTIPLTEGLDLAIAHSGPIALTVYERDHHNCLEHVDEITALTLEFIRDPLLVCAQHAAIERLDVAATVHVTDYDAAVVAAGGLPRRGRTRMPFIMPGQRTPKGA
ncbi:MAG: peptidase [Thermoleophilia bacterium]|nr:peptidase [Thermoleophilia bacterium]